MKTANELMKEYGFDNIKTEITDTPVYVLVARLSELEPKSHLIQGRSIDDQQLRAMANELDIARQSVQCLADTGRFKGELPEDLPGPASYQNLFSWLVALKDAIENRVPDSDMFNGGRFSSYGAWHKHLSTYHSDLPQLLSALAGRAERTNMGRDSFMNPCYYAGWSEAGSLAMDILFTSNEGAVVDSLLEKLEGLTAYYPQHTVSTSAVAALKHCILSKGGAAKLVSGGFNAKALEVLKRQHGYPSNIQGKEEQLAVTVIEMNLTSISQALDMAAEQAKKGEREAMQVADRGAAFAERKAAARRRVELQSKLADDTIKPEELQELETL